MNRRESEKEEWMKGRGVMVLALATLVAAGAMAACAPRSSDVGSADGSGSTETMARTPQEEMLFPYGARLLDSENSGKVQVLEDGTQIMLAPEYVNVKGMYGFHYETGEGAAGNATERNDEMAIAGTGFSEINYNVDVLNADERGCESCHTSLLATLNNFEPEHSGLSSGNAWLDVKSLGVEVCIACHTTDSSSSQVEPDFGEMIHTLHGTVAGEEKATCFQCHATVAHGFDDAEGVENMLGQEFQGAPTEWKLWDEVKYDQMKGIDLIGNVTGDFSFTQDEITPSDQLFNETWLQYSSKEIAEAEGHDATGLDEGFDSIDNEANSQMKEDIFNNWEFGVTGSVNEAKTWKMSELIAQATEAGVVKTVPMKEHCGITKLGGWQIGQAEVTGIPVEWLLEQAGGTTADAKFIDGESLDSSEIDGLNMGLFIGSTPLEWLDEHDVLVVYEINGERLSWAQGFPLQLWVGGAAADAYMKQLTNLVITNDETRMGTNTTELKLCMGPIQYPGFGGVKANCAITNTYEGQVVEAGKPYTFKGYADGWYEQIGGIMVSMDNGATWTKYDTPNTDVDRWVTWEFTWDVPDVNKAYVLDVKPYLADGSTTLDSVRVMINGVQGGVVE